MPSFASLGVFVKILQDLLLPFSCASCGSEGSFLCDTCRSGLSVALPVCGGCGRLSFGGEGAPAGRTCSSCRNNFRLYGFLSPFRYEQDLVKTLVHNLKYRRQREIADFFAETMDGYIKNNGIQIPEYTIVASVPLHSRRKRLRGFNQAELIARSFAQRRHLRYVPVLRKVRATPPQTPLTAKERAQNLAGAFKINPSEAEFLPNATLILIDDVKTTGATLQEAAATLRLAGIRRIWAITAAR